jgi:hypothetical protein
VFAVFELKPEPIGEDLPQELLARDSERREAEFVVAGVEIYCEAVVRRGVHKVAGTKRAMLRFRVDKWR